MFIEQIEQRLSVRTYQNRPLNHEDQIKINQILNQNKNCIGPFGSSIHPFFVAENTDKEQEKIGTYGFIKNAPSFFGATTKNSKNELIDFGYIFEKVILELTQHNFGTVWLGGTFHRSQFSHYISNDLFIPAISPVGYEDNKSITEKMIRIAAKSDRRKKISEFVFVNHFFNTYLENDLNLNKIFRYVQLAPSASNKQPWRFLVEGNQIHLYLERTPKYAEKLPFDIQYLDMGIAIYHLECSMKDLKTKYEIKVLNNPYTHHPLEYIISFVLHEGFIS